MPKEWKILCTEINETYEDRPNITSHLTICKYYTVKRQLLQAIDSGDIEALEELLNAPFVYRQGEKDYSELFQGGHHSIRWVKRYYLVTPVVEALFFDPALAGDFKEILIAMGRKDSLLEKKLIEVSSQNPTIPKCIFSRLTEDQLFDLQKEIEKLQLTDPQNLSVQTLADDLLIQLNSMPSIANGVEQLQFRLNFVELLHSKDHIFALNKNYRGITMNMVMNLLCFIPTIVNGSIHGNFLFFQRALQQSAIERIHSLLTVTLPVDLSDKDICPEEKFRQLYDSDSTEEYGRMFL